ncbi:MAG: TerB family tellurite resistance protein [Myxococcaceae bacterium]|nr:TerB family tellurite resistance protein [Myxococcaceae bacterium]
MTGFEPCLALFAALGGIVFFFVVRHGARGRSRGQSGPPLIASMLPAPAAPSPAAASTELFSRTDTEFSAERVERHTRQLADTITRAVEAGTTEPVHPWLSDGLFERVALEVSSSGDVALARQLATSRLRSVTIARFDRDEDAQTLEVVLLLSPKDGGHADATQVWTFHRRLAGGEPARGLQDGACPHCGAPLSLVRQTACAHCGAIVNSGVYDWVLCQVAPSVASGRPAVVDLSGLRVLDVGLTAADLEDRAGVIFWRWRAAAVTQRFEALSQVSTQAWHELPPAKAFPASATFVLRALHRLPSGRHQADVEARWVDADGHSERVVLQLSRAGHATTRRELGLATCRCTHCLAPVASSGSSACTSCGADFDDAWRLEGLLPFEAWQAHHVAAVRVFTDVATATGTLLSSLPRIDRVALLELAAGVALADGRLEDAERQTLERFTTRLGLDADALTAAFARPSTADLPRGRWSRAQSNGIVESLVELVFIDGHADLKERKLVERIARGLDAHAAFERCFTRRVRELMTSSRSS